jgi:hypothetical protein
MAVIGFTDTQIEQIRATAAQIPRRLRDEYLRLLAQLLDGKDFGNADVWRAAHAAAREVLQPDIAAPDIAAAPSVSPRLAAS